MKVTLYTTHCPKCSVLALKLKLKKIEFEECSDIEEMKKFNIKSAPILRVDDKIMDFNEAIKWVNAQA